VRAALWTVEFNDNGFDVIDTARRDQHDGDDGRVWTFKEAWVAERVAGLHNDRVKLLKARWRLAVPHMADCRSVSEDRDEADEDRCDCIRRSYMDILSTLMGE